MRNASWSLFAVLALFTTAGASDDPFIGKWILDPQLSYYPAGTCPKQMVIEMEPAAHGIRYQSDSTYANGRAAHTEYTADYNGQPALVWGIYGLMLPVSLKRMDSHIVIASYFKSNQVVATSRRVASRDGRQMTITTRSKDRSGRNITTIGIYRKQAVESPARDAVSQTGWRGTRAVIEPDYTQEFIPQQEPQNHLGKISPGTLALCFEIPAVLTAVSLAVGALIHQRRSQATD